MWYTDKNKYPKLLQEDLMIREEVRKSMKDAGLDSVKINKFLNKTEVIAYVGRPGVAIGRGGEGIDLLQKQLSKKLKTNVEIKIREVSIRTSVPSFISFSAVAGTRGMRGSLTFSFGTLIFMKKFSFR